MRLKPQSETLGQAVLRAVADSGLTRAEVSRRAGIGYGAIHGFVGGTKGLSLTTAQKILDALDYRIELHKRKRPTRGTKR